MGVHVESVDRKVVSGEVERFKHLSECEMSPITENDDLLYSGKKGGELNQRKFVKSATYLRTTLHLALDESKHVLLVHTRRVVNVRIDLGTRKSPSVPKI